ncbi:hypothetical protein GQX73_g7395 [Xylaria multiplex]|uniref:C2H2-type domain-containing protein n=1 Tax=Xylaria multiplex TaxID=323545 RepID=A0A7C8N478_9PEZI|nr:hypothetical protein GQX73_g7395 [Xylaria multiplex]
MSILPTAPPKKRKTDEKEMQRQRNTRGEGNAVEDVSITAEGTICEDSINQVTYEGTDEAGSKSVTAVTPIPVRSVAITDETRRFVKESSPQSSHVEEAQTSENFASLVGRNLALMGFEDDFHPNAPKDIMQSRIAEPQGYNPFQSEESEAPKLEEGPMTTMDLDSSMPAGFPGLNFDFNLGPKILNANTAFNFNPEVVFNNWSIPNLPSMFTGPMTTAQSHMDPSQIQHTAFRRYPGRDGTSDWNQNASNQNDSLFSPSFYGRFQGQEAPALQDAANIPVCGCSSLVGRSTDISKIPFWDQATLSGKVGRKRSPSVSDKGDRDDKPYPNNYGRANRDTGGQPPLFACPFIKHDPQRYQVCSKYTLRRIKDVRQHIYRHHCRPEIYCPRCSANFKCLNERDNHIREAGCDVKEMPSSDGIISENQRKELKDCGGRGTSKEHQWIELWKVIFPGAKPPRSPYIENDQAELLASLRRFWGGNANQIISTSLGEPSSESMTSTIIKAIDTILDRFEAESTSWDISADKAISGIPGQPLSPEDWVWIGSPVDFSTPPSDEQQSKPHLHP